MNSSPSKDDLYGEFQRTQRWRDKLGRRLAHKSLDIPDDEMNTQIRNGFGWRELAVLAGLTLGCLYLYRDQPTPAEPTPTAPAVQPVQSGPIDSEYEVRFYDADGQPIRIDPFPGKSPTE